LRLELLALHVGWHFDFYAGRVFSQPAYPFTACASTAGLPRRSTSSTGFGGQGGHS
jgi:hypothetical protein